MDNPWLELPDREPFVLPMDRVLVDAFNARVDPERRLDLTVLPQPFLGRRDANLVVLGRNPGSRGWTTGSYADALREDLRSINGTALPPLRPAFVHDDGRWWGKCFKAVLAETGKSSSWLADRVLSVEFHGYHSERYRRMREPFPSQRYGFWLVEQAVRRGATVVVMRGERDWKDSVPALQASEAVVLRNPRSATISPRNCGHDGFQRVLGAIE